MADRNHASFVPINTRSPEQWDIIRAEVDFVGKKVLDLGCGHGDLLMFAQNAGANVLGVDNKSTITTKQRKIPVLPMSIQDYLLRRPSHFDVVFCFSVLPYVRDIDAILDGLRDIADIAFVEVQLKGDGPGTMTEAELWGLLAEQWESVRKIGHTVVQGRNTERPIWLCERGIVT